MAFRRDGEGDRVHEGRSASAQRWDSPLRLASSDFSINDSPVFKPEDAARAARMISTESLMCDSVKPIANFRRFFLDDSDRDAERMGSVKPEVDDTWLDKGLTC